jgi:hypothetical protein
VGDWEPSYTTEHQSRKGPKPKHTKRHTPPA